MRRLAPARTFAVLISSCLLGTAVVALSTSSSTAASQSGGLRTLPGVVGPSTTKATSSASADLVVAAIRPARSGRTVTFYRRSDSFAAWQKVKAVRTASTGDATLTTSSAGQYAWKATAAKSKDLREFTVQADRTPWTNTFAEEFNTKHLSQQWRQRYPNAWRPGRTCSHTAASQVTFSGKTAVLTTKRLSARPKHLAGKAPSSKSFKKTCKDKSGKPRHYVGASIDTSPPTSSQYAFTYGVAAARIKFSSLPGQHAAFWLQTKETQRKDTEIDVVESNGLVKSRPLVAGLHYWTGKKAQAQQVFLKKDPKRWSKGYHVFSVEWTPTSYVYRIDSTVVLTTNRGLSTSPHDIVLSNVVADWAIRHNNGKSASMSVDWVRVWQKQ